MADSSIIVLFLMAWRNLWRNRVRTLILISAIGGSYGLSLFTMGMGDDMHGRLADKAGELAGGHALIHAEGFDADRKVSQVIDATPALLKRLRAAPGVRDVAPRILISGLLATSESSSPITLRAIDLSRERALADPGKKLIRGEMPRAGDGGDLGYPIALGKGVVEELGVTLGDRVVLTATRADGEVGRALFLLSGVLATGSRDLDNVIAYTTLAGGRQAIGLTGTQVHELGVIGVAELPSSQIKAAVLAALKAWDSGPGAGTDPNMDNSAQLRGERFSKRAEPACGGKAQLAGLGRARRAPKMKKKTEPNARRTCSHLVQSPGARHLEAREVLTWQQAMPEIVGFIEIDNAFSYVFLIVLFIIVAFAITNSFLMVVMERVREFGLLSALGVTGARLATLLLLETAVLTLVSLGIGFAFGFAGHLAMQRWGVDLVEMYGSNMGIGGVDMGDTIIHSELRPVKWLIATVGAALLVMTSALYPAWKATRMAPAEAMRFYD